MYSLDDTDDLGSGMPQPIDGQSVSKGNFNKLSEGEGAVAARREKGADKEKARAAAISLPRRTLIILGIASVIVISVCSFLFTRAIMAPLESTEPPPVTRVLKPIQESVEHDGSTYSILQHDGIYTLMEKNEGSGTEVAIGDLPGTPLCLILFDGCIILPENLPDGTWNVATYTVGASMSMMADQGGAVYGGPGTLQEAKLNGSTLHLVVDGQPQDIPLEW